VETPAQRPVIVLRPAVAAVHVVLIVVRHEHTRDEATTLLSSWMNYIPGGIWDERLGERSGAGRRAK
jgi:hypothetical protein